MGLPGFSVRRPVFTTMVTLMVLIIGLFALSRLKIDMLPQIELPTLTIRTQYEGASPEVMERLITRIIEEIVATVPGIREMTSTSSEGNSNVTVAFEWGTDIDVAALDVRAVLEDEINELPDDIVRPRIRKFDVNNYPVVLLGIYSQLDPVELTRIIEDQIRYRFSRIPGVAQVDLWGEFNREIRIELDPDRVKALGLPLDRVIAAVKNANVDQPAGKIEKGRYEVVLRAPAEFSGLDQIRNTVLAVHQGAAVTLGQVATVRDTYEKRNRFIRVNGEQGIRVAIRKQADANTVDVSRRILSEIRAANQAFPQLKIVPVTNQGNFIERSISNVARSVMYGGGLAVLILFFFLRNFRSTFIISLAIPLSMIATFALMFLNGFTFNLMTLGGLALGVGMMVDSAIVVLENIFRRSAETGEAPDTAAIRGADEVGPAITAATVTTLVIFLPLVFVRGVSGILFTEMAYVIIFALGCSLLAALSLVPMMAAKLLRLKKRDTRASASLLNRFFNLSEALFDGLSNAYLKLLGAVLNHPVATVAVSFALLGAALQLIPGIGTEFMPSSDEGEVRVTGEMEVGTRLELADRQTRLMEAIVYPAVPEAVSSVVSVGASGRRPGDTAKGDIQMSLPPSGQRERANTEIARDLRQRLEGKIPGMKIRARAPRGQFLLERVLNTEEGLTVDVRGFDLAVLDALAKQADAAIQDVPGITDTRISLTAGVPQEEIRVERDKAADLGISVRNITDMISTAVVGAKAGEFRQGGESCRILVKLKDAEKRSLDEILDLTLETASGGRVALRNLVSVTPSRGPMLIERKEQQRVVSVSANVAGRDLGSVAAEVENKLAQVPRPAGYDLIVAGGYREQQQAFQELLVSLVLALVLVYMVMACQYESLINPLVVMFSVPMAAIGVLVTLYLTGTTLNIQSYIGCIMLGGIVVNNAILLVDQAGQLFRSGTAVRDAVMEAGRRRLRPILMTTLTTILGLLPLALGVGEGADAQAPLARAVVGGLAGSTLITLFLIPAVYTLFHPEPKGS
ncbi:MAG TPA: acriflavin resistance protein [Desulfobacteraceae bacterium]|nr:acriflavin resistance protein [Desulfobacteraceae bacterium]